MTYLIRTLYTPIDKIKKNTIRNTEVVMKNINISLTQNFN